MSSIPILKEIGVTHFVEITPAIWSEVKKLAEDGKRLTREQAQIYYPLPLGV